MLCSRKLEKSYLWGGLYKISIRTGLDLGRRISIKILFVLMQKLGFWLYEIEFFNKTSYTSSSSGLVGSYLFISFYFNFTTQKCVLKFSFINPIALEFVSLAV